MATGSYGANLIRRNFGRLTARAGWNGVAGAFGKLQEEANGGRVRKIEGKQIEEEGIMVARQEFVRKRGDLCRKGRNSCSLAEY